MKKLMIGLVGALAMAASAEVTSSNIVGFQGKSVTLGYRAMRSAATFLNSGDNPLAVKISDIKQTVGDPGDLVLCLYNDNVKRLAEYWYISEEVAVENDFPGEGWYLLNSEGDLDVEKGPQNADLPYGQGCIIESSNSGAEYVSAGEVDSIKREFTVPLGARKMMGNVLPRAIMLSELKQTVGDPGDLVFCTYNNNVKRLAEYWYISEEAALENDIPEAGWYILTSDGDLDIEAGTQDFEIPSGQGFVIESSNSSAVLQFPKAM